MYESVMRAGSKRQTAILNQPFLFMLMCNLICSYQLLIIILCLINENKYKMIVSIVEVIIQLARRTSRRHLEIPSQAIVDR